MDLALRSFRNTDFSEIVRVWNSHHRALGPHCQIEGVQLELSCLSKPYFDETDCCVATVGNRIVGFAQLGYQPSDQMLDLDPAGANIAAICVEDEPESPASGLRDEVAQLLINGLKNAARKRGAAQISFRASFPSVGLFLGLGPGGSMIGVTNAEAPLLEWLTGAGFNVVEELSLWHLDLASFRPPVDREQMLIRRKAQVNRDVDEPLLPWWQACVLGHTDPCSLQLSLRAERRIVGEVLFWTVAPELKTSPETCLWLWPPRVESEGAAHLLFLIAESLREFSKERLDTAVAVSSAHQTQLNDIYRRLGFNCVESGALLEASLTDNSI